MCLILLATDADPRYSLIVAANRDEAYDRPSAAAGFWADQPDVYGGRDLEQGGSWLAVAKTRRFAAVTNYRLAEPRGARQHSRGDLPREYVTGDVDAKTYLERISGRAGEYNGFSLIVGAPERLYFFSNHGAGIQKITAGVHGLSNHLLDEPWPKVQRGITVLTGLLSAAEDALIAQLFALLADRTPAPDTLLPTTGVPLQRERDLSAAFIAGDTYGTRASTVVLVSRFGEVFFVERTYGRGGAALGTSERRFAIEPLTSSSTAARA